jgi:hypothetical protein
MSVTAITCATCQHFGDDAKPDAPEALCPRKNQVVKRTYFCELHEIVPTAVSNSELEHRGRAETAKRVRQVLRNFGFPGAGDLSDVVALDLRAALAR